MAIQSRIFMQTEPTPRENRNWINWIDVAQGRHILQYRRDFYNSRYHATFAAPTLWPTNPSFRVIISQASISSNIQMALRLVW